MSIKPIVDFFKDERGSETVEFGITSVVIAAGAVNGLSDIQAGVKNKQGNMVAALDRATS
jgi:Flp pilus assembly pilin Flp